MRLSRFPLYGLAAAASVAACGGNEVTTPARPPLAGVRFINALPDAGFSVDIRMVDQVEWSAVGNNVAFRAGTEHQPTEAGARHLRVFLTSTNIDTASVVLLDTTVTFEANKNTTLILTGSRAANTERFWMVDDTPPACNNDVAVRAINAGAALAGTPVSLNLILARTSAGTKPPPTAAISGVAPLTASAYISRPADTTYVRTYRTGGTADDTLGTVVTGPVATAPLAGQRPLAGVNTPCTAYSVVTFPARVKPAGTGATAIPGTVLFLDRVP